MNTLPLHPVVVHFPIVLGMLTPLIIGFLLWAIKKGWVDPKAWILIVVLQASIVGTTFLAMQAGEKDEEAVEKIVKEEVIEQHEEYAEAFLWASIVVLGSAGAGFFISRAAFLKPLTLILSLVALAPLVLAGHSGGELVYKHGAASAHSQSGSQSPGALVPQGQKEHDDD